MLLIALMLAAASPPATSYEEQTVALVREYLAIDTSNPPGNEAKGAALLARELAKSGIKAQVFQVAPKRADVYAILESDDQQRPLILSNHIDVVGADPKEWKHPPFSGALIDGEIWGRGALDMKTTGIVQLMVMRMLKQAKKPLHRDVIFLALADEEADGTGALFMAKQKKDLIQSAELLLNEGANIFVEHGRVTHYGVATTEKALLWLELEVKGEGGHGATPSKDGALDRLIAALDRLRRAETPVRMIPAVERYFAGIQSKPDPSNREHNALIRDTVAITSVNAGDKVNVIPGSARATLDCRLLPGSDKAAFMKWLRIVLADDRIAIKETLDFPTLESPIDTPLMRAIVKVAGQYDPGVPVVPMLLTGTTDSSVFRELGIVAYGFEPYALTDDQLALQHGADERISVENVKRALRFTYELVAELVF